jgi:hypothetical protein
MTRDFLISFRTKFDCLEMQSVLNSLEDSEGVKLFDNIDNRGNELFVTLTYSDNLINVDFANSVVCNDDFVFVALKNGVHNQRGYYFDTNHNKKMITSDIAVTAVFSSIISHFT